MRRSLTLHAVVQAKPPSPRAEMLFRIQRRITERGTSLAQEIARRELYFRVSVVGGCNLSCRFCHNEGAPTTGYLALEDAEAAIAAAAQVGFTRVQFTGGEPLLRKDIGDFVQLARRYVSDVGVTTNGTFLIRSLNPLVAAGIVRIHVSLQIESLIDAGNGKRWGVPDWLAPTIARANAGAFDLRLNLPVPADCLPSTEQFLELLEEHRCDVKVFSVLPEGISRADPYPFEALEEMVARINSHRAATGRGGELFLRGYRPPAGIRCPTCSDRDRCKEQSHSLRLGSDLILRPCLATRDWDTPLRSDLIEESIREAALLALDYRWDEL